MRACVCVDLFPFTTATDKGIDNRRRAELEKKEKMADDDDDDDNV